MGELDAKTIAMMRRSLASRAGKAPAPGLGTDERLRYVGTVITISFGPERFLRRSSNHNFDIYQRISSKFLEIVSADG